MKTLRIALVAVVLTCTMVSLARAEDYTTKPRVIGLQVITLEKAMQIPGLAAAIYQQVNLNEILGNHNQVYVATVKYRGVYYKVSGTRDEWLKYFWRTRKPPIRPAIDL